MRQPTSSRRPTRGTNTNGSFGRRSSCRTTRFWFPAWCRIASIWSSIPNSWRSASCGSPARSGASASLPAPIAASARPAAATRSPRKLPGPSSPLSWRARGSPANVYIGLDRRDAQIRLRPELTARACCAFDECGDLLKRDLRLDLAVAGGGAKTAVGAGDDSVAAEQFGEAHDALCHQLRMFDIIGGRVDNAGQKDFISRQRDFGPHGPLMLMPRVGGFERNGLGFDAKNGFEHLVERNVMGVRALVIAPANVDAQAIRRDIGDRAVERFQVKLRASDQLVLR